MSQKNEEDLREFQEELLADSRADELHDSWMRRDIDNAFEYCNFNEEMTIREFKDAVRTMQEYWDVDEKELLDSI